MTSNNMTVLAVVVRTKGAGERHPGNVGLNNVGQCTDFRRPGI